VLLQDALVLGGVSGVPTFAGELLLEYQVDDVVSLLDDLVDRVLEQVLLGGCLDVEYRDSGFRLQFDLLELPLLLQRRCLRGWQRDGVEVARGVAEVAALQDRERTELLLVRLGRYRLLLFLGRRSGHADGGRLGRLGLDAGLPLVVVLEEKVRDPLVLVDHPSHPLDIVYLGLFDLLIGVFQVAH